MNNQHHTSFLLRLSIATVMLFALSACHGDGLSRDQRQARRAAERCYKYLRTGRYDRFVDEIAYADQMSPEYRRQMQDLVHESAHNYEAAHGKMLAAEAVGDTLMGDLAHIYLQVTYADSTSEEIGLPMVCIDGDWKMQ